MPTPTFACPLISAGDGGVVIELDAAHAGTEKTVAVPHGFVRVEPGSPREGAIVAAMVTVCAAGTAWTRSTGAVLRIADATAERLGIDAGVGGRVALPQGLVTIAAPAAATPTLGPPTVRQMLVDLWGVTALGFEVTTAEAGCRLAARVDFFRGM